MVLFNLAGLASGSLLLLNAINCQLPSLIALVDFKVALSEVFYDSCHWSCELVSFLTTLLAVFVHSFGLGSVVSVCQLV